MQLIDKELADIAAVQLAGIQFNMTLANQENEMLRKAVRDLQGVASGVGADQALLIADLQSIYKSGKDPVNFCG